MPRGHPLRSQLGEEAGWLEAHSQRQVVLPPLRPRKRLGGAKPGHRPRLVLRCLPQRLLVWREGDVASGSERSHPRGRGSGIRFGQQLLGRSCLWPVPAHGGARARGCRCLRQARLAAREANDESPPGEHEALEAHAPQHG